MSMQATNLQLIEKRICMTSEEVAEAILWQVGARTPEFIVNINNSLPEAKMDGRALLRTVLDQDSGFIRWGYESARVFKTTEGESVAFRFQVTYRTTQEEDIAARTIAAAIADLWQESGLSDRQKVEKLIDYISANWRYDESYHNMTAYSTFIENKGVCLGMVLSSQLVLDELGIPSKAVNGKIISAKALHIVLLVKIDDLWYYFDPAEFVSRKPGSGFNLQNDYADHFTPDPAFLTEAFRKAHPMNESDLSLSYVYIEDNDIPIEL